MTHRRPLFRLLLFFSNNWQKLKLSVSAGLKLGSFVSQSTVYYEIHDKQCSMLVIVAQRALPLPEDTGSNQVKGNFYILETIERIEKKKIVKNEFGNSPRAKE